MEKTNGYYVAKYLKNNALVLVCELVVVLLLSLICTIIIEADPLWLAPVIGVVTYLFAEIRFMMAYVATNARHEHDMAIAKGEIAEEEIPAQKEQETASVAAEQNEEPKAQIDDVEDGQEPEECCASDVEDDEPELQSNEGEQKEQPQVEAEAEPVFDHASAQTTLEMSDEDEAMDALFGAPLLSQENETDIELESIDMGEDDLDDMTMDGDDFARDVLEIGEVAPNTDGEEQ